MLFNGFNDLNMIFGGGALSCRGADLDGKDRLGGAPQGGQARQKGGDAPQVALEKLAETFPGCADFAQTVQRYGHEGMPCVQPGLHR